MKKYLDESGLNTLIQEFKKKFYTKEEVEKDYLNKADKVGGINLLGEMQYTLFGPSVSNGKTRGSLLEELGIYPPISGLPVHCSSYLPEFFTERTIDKFSYGVIPGPGTYTLSFWACGNKTAVYLLQMGKIVPNDSEMILKTNITKQPTFAGSVMDEGMFDATEKTELGDWRFYYITFKIPEVDWNNGDNFSIVVGSIDSRTNGFNDDIYALIAGPKLEEGPVATGWTLPIWDPMDTHRDYYTQAEVDGMVRNSLGAKENVYIPGSGYWSKYPLGITWWNSNWKRDIKYFEWGDVVGHDQYSTKKFATDWSDYKWSNGKKNSLTKYNTVSEYGDNGYKDDLTTIVSSDDGASQDMGGGWRLPTAEEFETLKSVCDVTYVTNYSNITGLNGHLFTSKTNRNAQLFFPMAGCFSGGKITDTSYGYYWSSSLASKNQPANASFLNMPSGSSNVGVHPLQRTYGCNIMAFCKTGGEKYIHRTEAEEIYAKKWEIPSGGAGASIDKIGITNLLGDRISKFGKEVTELVHTNDQYPDIVPFAGMPVFDPSMSPDGGFAEISFDRLANMLPGPGQYTLSFWASGSRTAFYFLHQHRMATWDEIVIKHNLTVQNPNSGTLLEAGGPQAATTAISLEAWRFYYITFELNETDWNNLDSWSIIIGSFDTKSNGTPPDPRPYIAGPMLVEGSIPASYTNPIQGELTKTEADKRYMLANTNQFFTNVGSFSFQGTDTKNKRIQAYFAASDMQDPFIGISADDEGAVISAMYIGGGNKGGMAELNFSYPDGAISTQRLRVNDFRYGVYDEAVIKMNEFVIDGVKPKPNLITKSTFSSYTPNTDWNGPCSLYPGFQNNNMINFITAMYNALSQTELDEMKNFAKSSNYGNVAFTFSCLVEYPDYILCSWNPSSSFTPIAKEPSLICNIGGNNWYRYTNSIALDANIANYINSGVDIMVSIQYPFPLYLPKIEFKEVSPWSAPY